MRLTFLLSSLRLSGGVMVIVENANRLVQRGHQVTMIAPNGTLDPEIQRALLPSVTIIQPGQKIGDRQPGLLTKIRLAWGLARSTPPSDFIISTHTPTTASTWIASRLLKRGVPVWFYQDYIEMFDDRPVERWLLRHALGWHRLALVVSQVLKDELAAFRPGEIVVVSEGLSHTEHFKPAPLQARTGEEAGRRIVMYLGDMRPRKGLLDFLAAVQIVHRQIPDLYLWITSKEPCDLQTEVPYRFIFRPEVPELADLYAQCDLFVSASWYEGFGLPPLEAMACGAPVVLTDSRGVREYARPGVNCLMTPPQDPPALARAMLEVLTDPEMEQVLRQNGPPTAAEFTWERAAERIEQALLQIA